MSRVILDANLVLKSLLREPGFEVVERRLQQWEEEGTEFCVPIFFFSEVMSVIRNHVHRGDITETDGDEAFKIFKLFPARPLPTIHPYEQAWNLAKLYRLPQTYDAEYLALAEDEGCDFWTDDRRLLNSLGIRRPAWVKELVS